MDRSGGQADHDFAWTRRGLRAFHNVKHLGRVSELLELDSAHQSLPSQCYLAEMGPDVDDLITMTAVI
jgi:hypothetical protein